MTAGQDHGDGPRVAITVPAGGYERVPIEQAGLHETIMPVLGWTGTELHWLGTCFTISNFGLLLTARHVIDQFLQAYERELATDHAGLLVVWESDRPLPSSIPGVPAVVGGPMRVRRVSAHPTSDLALLQIELPVLDPPVELPRLRLNVTPPHVGQQCVALGLGHAIASGQVLPGTPSEIHYERQLAASRGTVQDVHRIRRDSFLLPFPCFLTDARYTGGMSGSPVVGEDGKVVGLVMSSTDTKTADGEPYTSYAVLLADAMALHVIMRTDGRERDLTLYELVEIGAVDAVGLDSFDVVEADDGHGYRVAYLDDQGHLPERWGTPRCRDRTCPAYKPEPSFGR